jgi:type II secretory pathway pseudopilin PulG
MVVIAIIIILAAIAIPNYLTMTTRAKKSRIASDMATLATGLETFKTDWGKYPIKAAYEAVDLPASMIYGELAGTAHVAPGLNIALATNAIGDTNGAVGTPFIEYIKAGTMASIIDPFKNGATANEDGHIYYKSDGNAWVLAAYTGTSATEVFLARGDSLAQVKPEAVIPPTYIP